MNTHSIRHAWFPPAIPKRKHDRELDSESEWPSAYRPLSGPALGSRPTKRLRHLEGGLAELTLKAKSSGEPITVNTDPDFLAPSVASTSNQIHDAPFDGEVEPYISSIYENASPYTGFGSSAASLPLREEVSEANTSDEDSEAKDNMEGRQTNGMRKGNRMFIQGEEGVTGYHVHEPESGPEKRKRDDKDDEHGLGNKGKTTWNKTEKERIVALDPDSSGDELPMRSPRRRRSAFSLSSGSTGSSMRHHSQTETLKDSPEFIINPTLLSHIPPPGSGALSIPREGNPAQSIILYKPVPWATGAPSAEEHRDSSKDSAPGSSGPSVQALSQVRDEDAMDIDS